MRIIDSYECSVHTHYMTDGERLTTEQAQGIERSMAALLLTLGIVFSLRIRSAKKLGRIHLVLECRPLPEAAEQIRSRLDELLKPLPVRPVSTARPEKRDA